MINGRGKFLIPGLCDMHVHIAGVTADPPPDQTKAADLENTSTDVDASRKTLIIAEEGEGGRSHEQAVFDAVPACFRLLLEIGQGGGVERVAVPPDDLWCSIEAGSRRFLDALALALVRSAIPHRKGGPDRRPGLAVRTQGFFRS